MRRDPREHSTKRQHRGSVNEPRDVGTTGIDVEVSRLPGRPSPTAFTAFYPGPGFEATASCSTPLPVVEGARVASTPPHDRGVDDRERRAGVVASVRCAHSQPCRQRRRWGSRVLVLGVAWAPRRTRRSLRISCPARDRAPGVSGAPGVLLLLTPS